MSSQPSHKSGAQREAWTICIHTTSRGDYDKAQETAEAMERAAKRAGCNDTMIEILEQDEAEHD